MTSESAIPQPLLSLKWEMRKKSLPVCYPRKSPVTVKTHVCNKTVFLVFWINIFSFPLNLHNPHSRIMAEFARLGQGREEAMMLGFICCLLFFPECNGAEKAACSLLSPDFLLPKTPSALWAWLLLWETGAEEAWSVFFCLHFFCLAFMTIILM